MGRSIAKALLREGAEVIICGRRMEPLQKVVTDEATSYQGKILAIQTDVSKEEDVSNLLSVALDKFGGKIDILINNAGISGKGNIHEHDIEIWDEVMAINLRGPFLLARAILPIMRSHKSGHIINISSEAGLEYYEGYGAYGVAKHALNALGEFIQRENQELGIRVNTICPGMVVTEMTDDLTNLNREKSLYSEDITDLVLWLLTRRTNVKIGRPLLIQTMENPWL